MKTLAKLTPTQGAIKYLEISGNTALLQNYLNWLHFNHNLTTDHASYLWLHNLKMLTLPEIEVTSV